MRKVDFETLVEHALDVHPYRRSAEDRQEIAAWYVAVLLIRLHGVRAWAAAATIKSPERFRVRALLGRVLPRLLARRPK